MQTNSQIDLAFELLQNTGLNLFLTGKAGTGKTTFLKMLKEKSPKRMIVVAPTGVAAINAGGVTIHSFFQLPFGPYIPPTVEVEGGKPDFKNQFRKEKINIIRSMDLLVIDEVSMVRADLLDAISDVLRRYRDHSKPFGGVQLLLIGDLQQLAPVAKEEEWNLLKEHYPSTFFFDSKALSESNYFCIELTQVYRQNDTNFVRLLNNIRENRFDNETLQILNQRYIPNFRPDNQSDFITLTTHNYQALQINNQKLEELSGEPCTFIAEIKDEFPEYSYPTDEKLTLKKGAQVMFVKNDSSPEKRYYNGKIGRILYAGPDEVVVEDNEGYEIIVEKETWQNIKYTIDPETQAITESISGTFCQYPLKTAWAITIHKSQGLTFERAIIDASAAFTHGQVYVALSRCKTLEGLILSSPINRNAIISDNRIEEYTTSTASRYPRKEQIQQAQLQYFTELLCELFDFHTLQQRIQAAAQVVYLHLEKLYPELTTQYAHTRDTFRTAVTDVGDRFILQLKQLIAGNAHYAQDELIQERVRKGVAYFLEQLEQLCTPLLAISNVDVDNKETKKVLTSALNKFKENLRIKKQTLQGCQHGFMILEYLSAKAKASIEPQQAASTRKQSPKAEKAEKIEKVEKSAKTEKKTKKVEKEELPPKIELSSDIKNPVLYESIKRWRYELSTKTKLPAYLILQQRALIGISNLLPINEQELLTIPGIGKSVVKKYGEEILRLVQLFKNGEEQEPTLW